MILHLCQRTQKRTFFFYLPLCFRMENIGSLKTICVWHCLGSSDWKGVFEPIPRRMDLTVSHSTNFSVVLIMQEQYHVMSGKSIISLIEWDYLKWFFTKYHRNLFSCLFGLQFPLVFWSGLLSNFNADLYL